VTDSATFILSSNSTPTFQFTTNSNTTMARIRATTTGKKRPASKAITRHKRRHSGLGKSPRVRYRTDKAGRKLALPLEGGVVPKQPRRYRPGTVALREIRQYQKSTKLLIRKAPFQRLVREICRDLKLDEPKRYTANAMLALQEAAEAYLVTMFSEAQLCSFHGGWKTLKRRDLRLLQRLKPDVYHCRGHC
jgi:histone H3